MAAVQYLRTSFALTAGSQPFDYIWRLQYILRVAAQALEENVSTENLQLTWLTYELTLI